VGGRKEGNRERKKGTKEEGQRRKKGKSEMGGTQTRKGCRPETGGNAEKKKKGPKASFKKTDLMVEWGKGGGRGGEEKKIGKQKDLKGGRVVASKNYPSERTMGGGRNQKKSQRGTEGFKKTK